jgi:large subunit ribosomal protein L18
MIDKNQSRVRRAAQTRHKISQLRAVRLSVHRTNSHIYAQVIDASGGKILAAASSAEKDVRAKLANGGNKAAAEFVGKRIA